MMKENKVLLFLEDFDEVMMERNPENNVASCNLETQEIILHYISKFEEEDLLMVGSANSVSEIDEEVLAPGRFDVMVPIFPPNAAERSEIILFAMTKGLEKILCYTKFLKTTKPIKFLFGGILPLK
jgi:SpoVK/Ycf46/Vps4 family AAA+-type ATPase